MAAESDEVLHDYSPLLKQYKNGRVERFSGTEFVPASLDPETGVRSKDVVIVPEINLWVRIFLPGNSDHSKKLPLLVYFHGGGFMVETAASPLYHRHMNLLVSEAKAVALSVSYRLAPEHPLPTAYEDSWLSIKWVASHSKIDKCSQPDGWIKDYLDLDRVFFGGDSAGGNIAHQMALRFGIENLEGINLRGLFLNCPFFSGKDPIGSEGMERIERVSQAWRFLCPNTSGCDDPLINPATDPNLLRLGCKRVLVYAAENDLMRDRNRYYGEVLKKSGWDGNVEVVEVEGEDHDFSVFHPTRDNSIAMLKRVAAFLNE